MIKREKVSGFVKLYCVCAFIYCLPVVWAIPFCVWLHHVDSKFYECRTQWEKAHEANNMPEMWIALRAESLANLDMFEADPRQWKRKWNRNYLVEAQKEPVN